MGIKRLRDDVVEPVGRSKRIRLPERITELEIKKSSGKIGTVKWAQSIMAMVAPMSANSNTRDAKAVARRVSNLNLAHGKIKFIIGHLINEQFPRPVGDRNFVPLTISANAAHKGQIETKLAKFLTGMNGPQGDKFNRMLDNGLKFGILYRVETSPNFWDGDIPVYMRWHVKLGVYNSNGVEQLNVEQELLDELKQIACNGFEIAGIDQDNGVWGQFGNDISTLMS